MHEAKPSTHPTELPWELPASLGPDPAPLKFIVNPNSPTGALFPMPDVESVVAVSSGVVAIDEAYVDFAPQSCLPLLEHHENVVLLRTFSKSYGLAGLRIGFALGPRDVIEALGSVKDSYNVDRLAIAAAVAAIEDEDHHRNLVEEVVNSMTRSDQLRRHMRSVEAAMRAYARRFGEDEERWGVLGLIHDWDYESGPTLDLHPMRGIQMLREKGWPEDILEDIASHADYLNVPRDTNARKALNAVDEMCGFIIACALVKPDKSLGSVEASTVRKKMKDKAFARGVHREELITGAEALGIPFDEHVEFVRDALKPIAQELGLNP